MKLKCIAIDDEPIALSIISRFCARTGYLELDTYSDPITGTDRIRQQKPDIVFLDIEMPGFFGLELIKLFPKQCLVIFTTAHANFAVNGFELEAIDYLLKPFSYDRFEKAVSKAREQITLRQLLENNSTETDDSKEKNITIKVEYKNVPVRLSSILYVEAMDNYVKIYLADKKIILSQMNLKGILQILPPGKFIRIHKSYVISRDKIVRFSKRQVSLINQTVYLPVGRAYAEEFWTEMQDTVND